MLYYIYNNMWQRKMKNNFQFCLDKIFQFEGGYVDNPHDSGGATKWGITTRTYAEFIDKPINEVNIKDLTKGVAAIIFKRAYWNQIDGDNLPSRIDMIIFDFAVSAGVSRARKIGVGIDAPDVSTYIKTYSARRLVFYKTLESFKYFGKGWINRINQCENIALTMIKWKDQIQPIAYNIAIEKKIIAGKSIKAAASLIGGVATISASAINYIPNYHFLFYITGAYCILLAFFIYREIKNHFNQIEFLCAKIKSIEFAISNRLMYVYDTTMKDLDLSTKSSQIS